MSSAEVGVSRIPRIGNVRAYCVCSQAAYLENGTQLHRSHGQESSRPEVVHVDEVLFKLRQAEQRFMALEIFGDPQRV